MNSIIQKVLKNREVVEILLKYPEREFTINELSRLAGVPYTRSWRFIKESDETGLVFLKKVGNYNVCRLNRGSPFTEDVVNALKTRSTPQKAVLKSLTSEMKKIKDIEKIVLFGSVARNMEKPGSDVDIALVINRMRTGLEKDITDAVSRVMEKSRIKIVPILLTKTEAGEKSQFSEEVRKGIVLYERRKGS
jgi:predicted nucleotidyltransferase